MFLAPILAGFWRQRRHFLPVSRIGSPSLKRPVSKGCGCDGLHLFFDISVNGWKVLSRWQFYISPCVWPQTMENINNPKNSNYENSNNTHKRTKTWFSQNWKNVFDILYKNAKTRIWDFRKQLLYVLMVKDPAPQTPTTECLWKYIKPVYLRNLLLSVLHSKLTNLLFF